MNFECPAARGDQGQRFDSLTEIQNLGRQTDGLGRVVSNYTIFNRYLGFHRAPFREKTVSVGHNAVKERRFANRRTSCSGFTRLQDTFGGHRPPLQRRDELVSSHFFRGPTFRLFCVLWARSERQQTPFHPRSPREKTMGRDELVPPRTLGIMFGST
jgi:hypothetical protein